MLLLIPGFITDAIGVLLLLAPLGAALRRGPPPQHADGVLDLEPEQWHRVSEQSLPHHDNQQNRQP
ncbi:MAG: FxsA family protein [Bradyrhizobium sp.]